MSMLLQGRMVQPVAPDCTAVQRVTVPGTAGSCNTVLTVSVSKRIET